MSTPTQSFIRSLFAGLTTLVAYDGLVYLGGNQPFNRIPRGNKVQAGYVDPSKLEIGVQDLEKNGQKETILRYDGTNYLFTLDEQGKPKIQSFEIIPAKIIPKVTFSETKKN